MKILSEKKEIFVKMEVEILNKEKKMLLTYAIDNMSTIEYKNLLIEWALIDILKRKLKCKK